ncbi:MAG TPA: ferredoxin family protein [Methylomusa anaerophila]|uniref:Ferredoxin-1 n=1 Tax=Methylomusa anaerophila TaxID=1930071 RepID=A0A348ALF9_9FIRM|nr:ferredoxin family protein [Methylomusa anaerophila]BBB91907.1 ferredoxin-1 [Methylomusa anaerophila]HML88362.1 ferredoxin family protein [Methylomusa anaerophila]
MSIVINKEKCCGCGKCREACPGSLLYPADDGKTCIRYPKDCWGCTSCVKECEYGAIQYYLGAEIGGKGGFLYTRQEGQGNFLQWIIVGPGGEERIITIDKNKANSY